MIWWEEKKKDVFINIRKRVFVSAIIRKEKRDEKKADDYLLHFSLSIIQPPPPVPPQTKCWGWRLGGSDGIEK